MKYYIGIDLGGTNIAVALLNENYEFISKYSTPTLAARGFEAIVEDMARACGAAAEQAGLTLEDIEHIGIGVPSTLNPKNRHVVFANNLGWVDKDVLAEFAKHCSSRPTSRMTLTARPTARPLRALRRIITTS